MNKTISFIASRIFPKFSIGIFNIRRHYALKMVKTASREMKPKQRILDAGAGGCQFEKYFTHTNYESTDFEQIFDKRFKDKHDFICNLDSIPRNDESYDVILNTEVLEHVPEPLKVLKEFHRILKKGGKLYLSTPQSWEVHGYPYNYFNFTKGGLEFLFKEAGFREYEISPKGGFITELAIKLKEVPTYILYQYFEVGKVNGKISLIRAKPLAIILIPLFLVSWLFFQIIIPLLSYPLDKLDRKKSFTLGYCCEVRK